MTNYGLRKPFMLYERVFDPSQPGYAAKTRSAQTSKRRGALRHGSLTGFNAVLAAGFNELYPCPNCSHNTSSSYLPRPRVLRVSRELAPRGRNFRRIVYARTHVFDAKTFD